MSTAGVGALGRFVRPREEAPGASLPFGLARVLEAAAPRPAGERCEVCGEAVPEEHSHVVHTENRSLMCTCRPCYLLFTKPGAAGGKYTSVPDRHLHDPDFALDDGQWEQLQIPVGMAFFFVNSALGRTVAFYPSPAGATESLLPLDTWAELMSANPLVATLAPDVEALIIRRHEGRYECYLVPVDACYELVGHVRLHWKGFDGGEEAHQAIDGFFGRLAERARPVRAGAR